MHVTDKKLMALEVIWLYRNDSRDRMMIPIKKETMRVTLEIQQDPETLFPKTQQNLFALEKNN